MGERVGGHGWVHKSLKKKLSKNLYREFLQPQVKNTGEKVALGRKAPFSLSRAEMVTI